jgi:hypothetical protein
MMEVRGLEVTFDGDQHIHCFGLDTQLGLRCRAVPAQWFLILVFFFLASPTMLSGNYCMLDEFEKPYSRSFEDFGLDRSFDSVGGIF